jgi:hypothetical protein
MLENRSQVSGQGYLGGYTALMIRFIGNRKQKIGKEQAV